MNAKQFVESLDIKNDFRTYLNFIKLPLIVLIRFPLVLAIWFFIWFGDFLEYNVNQNRIPGWDRYYPPRTKKE